MEKFIVHWAILKHNEYSSIVQYNTILEHVLFLKNTEWINKLILEKAVPKPKMRQISLSDQH